MNTPAATRFHLPAARRLALAALLAGAALPPAPSARAATFNWSGGASKDDWNLAANWQENAAPANDGTADLVFGFVGAGVNRTLVTPAYSIRSLTLSIAASAYQFGNGPLTLGAGGLSTSAANAQIFDTAVSLGADQIWTLGAGAGALSFNNRVATAGRTLTVSAASTTGSGNVINGNLVGNGSLLKTGAGVLSLTGTGNNPALADFDASHAYTFTLATAAGGILGFDPAEVSVDPTGFLNNLAGGSFSVLQEGNSLVLAFSPVPEPTTWAMVAGGLGSLLLLQRRREQRRWAARTATKGKPTPSPRPPAVRA